MSSLMLAAIPVPCASLRLVEGATVVGYEANRENYWLGLINLKDFRSVTLHQTAVWRSDVDLGRPLLFTPSANSGNTGGGSVMFSSPEAHWSAIPSEEWETPLAASVLTSHSVDPVALDDVLTAYGAVRVLKLDVKVRSSQYSSPRAGSILSTLSSVSTTSSLMTRWTLWRQIQWWVPSATHSICCAGASHPQASE
jgi:hypothetical protein